MKKIVIINEQINANIKDTLDDVDELSLCFFCLNLSINPITHNIHIAANIIDRIMYIVRRILFFIYIIYNIKKLKKICIKI